MVRALSAGKLSSYREGAHISGSQTSLLAEDEGPKQDLSQKLCCYALSQKVLVSVVHTLTSASPGHPNTPKKLDPDLKAYLMMLVEDIKKDLITHLKKYRRDNRPPSW